MNWLKRISCLFFTAGLLMASASGMSEADGVESLPYAEILPLSEIRPGMEGEFRTVIRGNEIESFPIRIIGVADHFVGPQRAVIFAEAKDDRNLEFGPVAGMSGSPVYVDGKLIGAYAYGYRFAKNQALFGIQPIESMMEISGMSRIETPGFGLPRAGPVGDSSSRGASLSFGGSPLEPDSVPSRGNSADEGGSRLGMEMDGFGTLPVPLMAGGFDRRVIDFFRPQLRKLGLDILQTPMGSSASGEPGKLLPGSPVAAVLLSGDFNIAGVGTVTWREGEDLLAFGHSFFQNGPTDLPMATADIITVVQSTAISFKLSNIGPVVGSIHQDRLTGLAGSIGRPPPTTQLAMTVKPVQGEFRTYGGELFQNRELGPTIAAMAMMQTLLSTIETQREQTIHTRIRFDIEGYEPFTISDVASGDNGAGRIIMDFLSVYQALLNNPFDFPNVRSVDFDFKVEDGWNQQRLEQVVVESGQAIAGKPLSLQIMMRDYHGGMVRSEIQVPIPEGTEGELLEIHLLDAAGANRTWNAGSENLYYRPRPDARRLDDLLAEIRKRQGYQSFYVRVFRESPGLRLRGADLENLPPSLIDSIASPKTAEVMQRSRHSLVGEYAFPTPGEFKGSYVLRVRVKD